MTLADSLTQYLALSRAVREIAADTYGGDTFVMTDLEFIYDNGRSMQGICKLDRSFYKPRSRMCYLNAWKLRNSDTNLRYCEGYMLLEGIPVPILHAWCINEAEEVVDISIEWDATAAYYGLEFAPAFAESCWSQLQTQGLLGILPHLPLLNIHNLESLKTGLVNQQERQQP